jgi:putative hydrolase
VWQKLCDPVARQMTNAVSELVPEQVRAQLGPMASMLTSVGGAVFGGQLGSALGSLAAEVLSAGDIGLPLGPAGTAALIPANIAAYGEGLEIPEDQVRLYVALREAAHQRLFGHVPWLRVARARRGRGVRERHQGRPGRRRRSDGTRRPERPDDRCRRSSSKASSARMTHPRRRRR